MHSRVGLLGVLQIKWCIHDYFGQDVGNAEVKVSEVWFGILGYWPSYWVEGHQPKIT